MQLLRLLQVRLILISEQAWSFQKCRQTFIRPAPYSQIKRSNSRDVRPTVVERRPSGLFLNGGATGALGDTPVELGDSLPYINH